MGRMKMMYHCSGAMFKGDSSVLGVGVGEPTTFLQRFAIVVQVHLAHLRKRMMGSIL